MQDPHELEVWAKIHELTLDVYRATTDPTFPRCWPLISQIQKSSLSVESNLVEGATRDNDAEFLQFTRYSISSAFELRTQLLVARDLGYLPPAVHFRQTRLLEEIRKMLWSLIETLERALGRRPPKYGPPPTS